MPARAMSSRLASLAGLSLLLAAVLLPSAPEPAHAQTPVVVVAGDYLGENGLPNQQKSDACSQRVVKLLKLAHVPHVVTRDSQVEREGLPAAAVAILPYNRAMTDAEAAHVCRFVADGGKVIVFFAAHRAILEQIGLRRSGMARAGAAEPFTGLSLTDQLVGAPATVGWAPEQVAMAEPSAGVTPLAMWQTKSGATTAFPAVLAHDNGIYFTGDPRSLAGVPGAQLLRALIGRLAPAAWSAMLPTDPAGLGPLGRFASLAELHAYVARQAAGNPVYAEALAQATAAQRLLADIKTAVEGGDIAGGLALEAEARQAAERALWASYPSLPGELRGVWMCNYAEPSWAVAARHLQDANFNAVFPYMMSGGVAFYPSKVLAVHLRVKKYGDSLAEAMAATRAVGLPLHARMLNLSTIFAPPEVVSALRKAGRLMVTSSGKSSTWLCPTNPTNRRMEVAAALEMASYGVAGIQFDYLRYPWKNTCCCKRCRAAFEQALGVRVARWPADVLEGCYRGRFADWRRERLTSLVAQISQALRRDYPRLQISAAVFLNWEDHRDTFGQDWVAWIEQGLVDFVCPMDYTPSMERFELYVSRQERWIAGRCPWAAGLGVYADDMKYGGPETAVEQIRVAREHGARGFVIFNYSPDLVRDYLPWLALGVTREPTEFAVAGR